MDLEIVGRHALLFDDDATAEVVNSGGSLVPWAAIGAADLLLDRHDVRHLLDHVPPRPRRSYSAALLSAPSPDGVSEAELDRERFLDLPADDGADGDDGNRDAPPSGDEEGNGQAGYNAVPFSYGSTADSEDPNSSNSYYRPSFYVPESLLNKLPPSEKVHQIIARTALFVSQHGGQSEIVLRVKQGSNPTFGFLMPDHHLYSYFRFLVDHPQLLKDGADAEDVDKDYKTGNTETEPTPSGGALSLLGTAYDSGDEDETVPANAKGMEPENGTSTFVQGHGNTAFILPDNKELPKDQIVTAESVGKTILMKKNPVLTGNSFVAAWREKAKDASVRSQGTKSNLAEAKEMILEPPSFLKRTMEKIVEFILRNGKEFEDKLIDQDRRTGRFPFLLSSNPYHSYYLKMLQETQESKSCGRSPENKDRRNSAERKDRSSSERRDRRSSSQRKDISHGRERSRSMERPTIGINAHAPDRSSAEPSEKQLREQQEKGKFQIVVGVKKEPPRKVTADEAAAIVMAATRGLSSVDDSRNTLKETRDSVPTVNDRSSSFGSFSSLQGQDAPSKHTSNSEADTSLTSSGQLKKEGTGIIDDDWIANTIAKAAAVAASKEADSSEATMTKEQKLKAERLRRAKMFAAIIKGGGSKVNDLATVADPSNEPTKAHSDDMNASTPDLPPAAKEREGSSVPFEREGSIIAKEEKDSDDERNRVRKYRKKHYPESDEDKNGSEESYKPSRKKHRSEHSRGHSKDVHKHKSHSKYGESRHRRHQYSSSEDDHELRSSKSRHQHRDRDHYDGDDDHRRSRRHRRDHRSSSKKNYEDDRDKTEKTLCRSEASPRALSPKIEPEKPPIDTAQSSGATEVPNELRAKIRAMLLETL